MYKSIHSPLYLHLWNCVSEGREWWLMGRTFMTALCFFTTCLHRERGCMKLSPYCTLDKRIDSGIFPSWSIYCHLIWTKQPNSWFQAGVNHACWPSASFQLAALRKIWYIEIVWIGIVNARVTCHSSSAPFAMISTFPPPGLIMYTCHYYTPMKERSKRNIDRLKTNGESHHRRLVVVEGWTS